MIDNLLLYRSVQVVRQLPRRNRNVGVFCNISAHSLVDAEFFPQFVDFMEHNRSLAGSMFFELSQSVVGGLGPVEVESMSALADHGFRFSMDHVTALDFDPQDLAERGFRFIKVPADLLLSSSEDTGAQIHPADLSDLLERSGIKLVAEKIENRVDRCQPSRLRRITRTGFPFLGTKAGARRHLPGRRRARTRQ